ncbi:DMSO/selenate family reductase complex A subunit [Bacillus sp. 1NLA3E]|uniref:DMSO/selenate family reductase complex A subunit n=1 Tax=Bacillus sp. 1NLA3E TaxID=666686 RepID=UPI000247F23D|nr:DMSO/selenate family reductase complex A subunit [Bacillus sp. 1NLA3E]AGK56048.1 anaerobic dimethyl sulfoxide reductase, A subunit, DmsA/YnfE [Bacillus sp. 1NLA3E]
MSDKNQFSKLISKNMKRRTFLKWSGAVAVPVIAGGIGTKLLIDRKETTTVKEDDTEVIVSTCNVNNCGGRCIIKAHVKDGVVVRVSTDTSKADDLSAPPLRACVRGRSYRSMLYHPDRLKYPMKRVGKRGEGKFERISWKEAVNTIASEMKRIGDKYGPESRFDIYATGQCWGLHGGSTSVRKLLSLTGGYLNYRNDYSSGAGNVATPYTYGDNNSGSSFDTLLHSKYIILWGQNPGEMVYSTPYREYLLQAKKNGAKIVVIDPRYTDTAITYADEWIPILPTTDNALMDAMGYVIVTEKLHDQAFLDKYCVGFDGEHMPDGVEKKESLKSYLLGEKDGIPKTPEWAEKICRVPADKIRQIAREYATTKPAALIQGWGPQRHAYGEQIMRGGAQLACLTGNVGKLGGWAAGTGYWNRANIVYPFAYENPVKASIPCFLWTKAVEKGTEMTSADGLEGAEKLDTNIKLIFSMASNMLVNQHADINKTKKLLEDESKVEFIVASDIFMTPSAKFADILIPATTFFERWDIGTPWCFGDYVVLGQKTIDPLYECRDEYDVFADVAEKLGVKDKYLEGRTTLDLVKESTKRTKKELDPNFPTFDEFRKTGVHHFKYDEPLIGYKAQIDDLEKNPFKTPSGKIELFSKVLWDMNNHEEIPAIAKYIPAWEGPSDPLIEQYPLQLISWHYKRRCHSTHDNNPWLEETAKQEMWINPIDAKARSISDGDRAKVFNGRGEIVIDVKVTNRIVPGVVAIPQGGWYSPNDKGIDQRGAVNVLTNQRPTALAKANPQLTNLVQVERNLTSSTS